MKDEFKTLVGVIVDYIVKDGTENTNSGNWIIYFSEIKQKFGIDLAKCRKLLARIEDELWQREEVAQVDIDESESCIGTTFYLDYCLCYEPWPGEEDEFENA